MSTAPLCACGCGQQANPGRRYVRGHNQRGKPSPRRIKPSGDAPLCACGCGANVLWNRARRRWNEYLHHHGRAGFRHSPEAIEKMRAKALARADQIAEHNRARVWSDESRKKLSESKRKIRLPHRFRAGVENPGYKHGRGYDRPSASILMRLRKNLIEERGFRCERCHDAPERNELLHMHHEDDDTFNNEPSNLVLLCATCHHEVHNA